MGQVVNLRLIVNRPGVGSAVLVPTLWQSPEASSTNSPTRRPTNATWRRTTGATPRQNGAVSKTSNGKPANAAGGAAEAKRIKVFRRTHPKRSRRRVACPCPFNGGFLEPSQLRRGCVDHALCSSVHRGRGSTAVEGANDQNRGCAALRMKLRWRCDDRTQTRAGANHPGAVSQRQFQVGRRSSVRRFSQPSTRPPL